ncbi:DUF2147 domain-containing protein [Sediminicola luteus]|uniref:DUF2147 domain-containing protein n=1 Tax=Sediminicola luteus TaxID=319238 RepID=A0A2A4G5T1_9FLAO|nr:DUF2147 domain-containing protein [Sediminicola luteus]PCE63781.1 hypothetical protein B7P33_10945 [Sediminicola luteus]
MKQLGIIALILCAQTLGFAQSKAYDILGKWETEARDGKMEIYRCGDHYCGTLLEGKNIINADGSSKKDVKNPDANLRSRDLVGMTILSGLDFDGEQYQQGRIYNADNGKTYKCYVWLEADILHLRGYLGLKAFGQTSKWHRIQ